MVEGGQKECSGASEVLGSLKEDPSERNLKPHFLERRQSKFPRLRALLRALSFFFDN